jgi:hypothetical protein
MVIFDYSAGYPVSPGNATLEETVVVNLDDAAIRGVHIPLILRKAMLLINNRGVDYSVGARWIMDNPAAFAKIVPDVHDFLRSCLDIPHHVFGWLLCKIEVMRLIPEDKRHAFIRDAYVQHGAFRDTWADVASELGMSREQIGEAIIGRLEFVKVERGMANDVHEFIEDGSGMERANEMLDALRRCHITEESISAAGFRMRRFDPLAAVGKDLLMSQQGPKTKHEGWMLPKKGTLWSWLSDEQFVRAIRVCAEKSPSKLLEHWMKVELRITDEALTDSLKGETVQKLQSVSQFRFSLIRHWTPDLQQKALKRFRDLLPAASKYAMSQVDAAVLTLWLLQCKDLSMLLALYEEFENLMVELGADTVYEKGRPQLKALLPEGKPEFHVVAKALRDKFFDLLRFNGYAVGEIEEHDHPTKGGRQLCVVIGGNTYVQRNGSHRYFPNVGDLVIVDIVHSSPLHRKVFATNFTLLEKSAEVNK